MMCGMKFSSKDLPRPQPNGTAGRFAEKGELPQLPGEAIKAARGEAPATICGNVDTTPASTKQSETITSEKTDPSCGKF